MRSPLLAALVLSSMTTLSASALAAPMGRVSAPAALPAQLDAGSLVFLGAGFVMLALSGLLRKRS